jgi:predicted regulator of Ras-like GTPase activity (Roadblock/LC7/MglB family)
MNNKNEIDNDEMLLEKLKEIKNQEGIIGYILRSSNSAAIDLKDPQKTIDYAVLSSAVLEVSNKMTEKLQVDEVEKAVVETEETKLLSMRLGNKQLSIFMEQTVNHNKLYKELK